MSQQKDITVKVDDKEVLAALTPEEIAIFFNAFTLFDKDCSGTITRQEIQDVFKSLKQEVSTEQLDDLLGAFDQNNDGSLDFTEFLKMMIAKQQQANILEGEALAEDSLKEAFKMFDADGNGKIDANELKSGMELLGEGITLEESEQMLKEADSNGDGVLDYDEFVQCLQK